MTPCLDPAIPDPQPAPIRLAVVLGSSREGRLCDAIARWLLTLVRECGGFTVDVIDPLTLALPVRMSQTPDTAVLNLRKRIGNSDAIVLLTPEYNHGYPAALKQVIDHVVGEWAVKPVALFGYGGHSGGHMAIGQLRQVLAALDAVPIREALALPMAWNHIDDDGALQPPDPTAHAAQRMLARLAWWARGLALTRQLPLRPLALLRQSQSQPTTLPDWTPHVRLL